jgi:hypothetical protein
MSTPNISCWHILHVKLASAVSATAEPPGMSAEILHLVRECAISPATVLQGFDPLDECVHPAEGTDSLDPRILLSILVLPLFGILTVSRERSRAVHIMLGAFLTDSFG